MVAAVHETVTLAGDIPVAAVSWDELTLKDDSGTTYFEYRGTSTYTTSLNPQEGAVRYVGCCRHGGGIVLKPFFVLRGGKWQHCF